MASSIGYPLLYREVQPYSSFWIWGISTLFVVFAWYSFIQQVVLSTPLGPYPPPDFVLYLNLFICGIILPYFVYSLKLITEVRPDCVYIRFHPLKTKKIYYDELAAFEAVMYHPVADYGGWGIRWSSKRGWAYTASGYQAILFTYQNGKQILLGTSNTDQLFEKINEAVKGGEC